jgi:hypothetical protein
MADPRLIPAIDALKEEVDDLLRQVADQKKLANALAAKAGVAPPYDDVSAPAGGSANVIRADQFANHSAPSAAARAYLEMRGPQLGAASVDVIFDALQRGGFAFTMRDDAAKKGLSIALGKDSNVRYLKGSQTWGLWSWYPHAKRDKEKKSTSADGSTEAPAMVEESMFSDLEEGSDDH